MAQRVIRLSQLASTKSKPGLLPVAPATIWRWCKAGVFPKPFKLGKQTTVWSMDAVESFIATRSGVSK